MKPKTLIVSVAIWTVTAIAAQARIGWTLDECIRHYGPRFTRYEPAPGWVTYDFLRQEGHFVSVGIFNGRVRGIMYGYSELSLDEVLRLLAVNIPEGCTWEKTSYKIDDRGAFVEEWDAGTYEIAFYFPSEKVLFIQLGR
jgi:hypothetical protein